MTTAHPPAGSWDPDPSGAQLAAARDEAHHGPSWRGRRHGTALCLSGGGYRAALLHLGALRRLNELGILGSLRSVSAVSGGALVASLLADPRLGWPAAGQLSETVGASTGVHGTGMPPLTGGRVPGAPGVGGQGAGGQGGGAPGRGHSPLPDVAGGLFSNPRVKGFDEYIAAPLYELVSTNVRTPALVRAWRPRRRPRGQPQAGLRRSSSNALADELARAVPWWAGDLRDLRRAGPAVVIGATDLGHGVNWTFADPVAHPPSGRVGDFRRGYGDPPPGLRVADAVAASCAYPPWFAPFELRASRLRLAGGVPGRVRAERQHLVAEEIQLGDGGIYDNLALEPVWRDHKGVLVSDGGAVFRATTSYTLWGQVMRTISIASGAGETTRLRWLHSAFKAGIVEGATWGTDACVPACYPPEVAEAITRVRTDMDVFSRDEQKVIERHGYAVADAAVRRHAPGLVLRDAPPQYPHPEVADPQVALAAVEASRHMTIRGRRRRETRAEGMMVR